MVTYVTRISNITFCEDFLHARFICRTVGAIKNIQIKRACKKFDTRLSAIVEQVVPHFNREADHYKRVGGNAKKKSSNERNNRKN